MSDDIVARPCCDVRPCGCADARMVIDHLHAEIERLRAEVNLWMGAAERFAESHPQYEAFRYYFRARTR